MSATDQASRQHPPLLLRDEEQQSSSRQPRHFSLARIAGARHVSDETLAVRPERSSEAAPACFRRTEATVAVVADGVSDATTLLQRLGPTGEAGSMTFDAALELQGSFYDDGTFDERSAFQIDRLWGTHGECWVLVEPNGFRTSFDTRLLALAEQSPAVSFF